MNRKIIDILQKVATDIQKCGGAKIASAVVFRDRILGLGVNQYKSNPLQLKYARNPDSIFLHAEIDAIRSALRRAKVELMPKCDLYIIRIRGENIFGNARPCPGCMRAIEEFGFKRIIYSGDGDEETPFPLTIARRKQLPVKVSLKP